VNLHVFTPRQCPGYSGVDNARIAAAHPLDIFNALQCLNIAARYPLRTSASSENILWLQPFKPEQHP
jgi:hypothetical protein